MIERGANDFQKSFNVACEKNKFKIVQLISEKHPNLDYSLKLAKTIYDGSFDISLLLLEKKANPNIMKHQGKKKLKKN